MSLCRSLAIESACPSCGLSPELRSPVTSAIEVPPLLEGPWASRSLAVFANSVGELDVADTLASSESSRRFPLTLRSSSREESP